MKYWTGFFVAAIVAACTWALKAFAQAHTVLVDMIYPYVSRMIQDFLAQWSGAVSFSVWQVALLALLAVALATFVLMLVLRWNPLQWAGWVAAGVSLLVLLNMGIYGLNEYSGPLADDLRLGDSNFKYSVSELEEAAVYFRDQANALAEQTVRNADGEPAYPDFETMAQQAAEGFETLTYQEHHSVFAGTTVPVKQMAWSGLFDGRHSSGMLVPLTGEATVNPKTPAVFMPYAMCLQMARRMCIARAGDPALAAFMAARANSQPHFQYAAYLAAYRYCSGALEEICAATGSNAILKVEQGENADLKRDLESYDKFFGRNGDATDDTCDLLVLWHLQTVILPQQVEPEEDVFDPRNPQHVDIPGLAAATP